MKTRGFKLLLFLLGVAAISLAVMFLWNLLVPGIFGWSSITYWQALGLFVLARILFGGLGAGRMWMAHGHGMDGRDRNPLREKWMKMTAEERNEFVKKRSEFMRNVPFSGRDFFGRGGFDPNDSPERNNE